ncbi:site-specific integrase [Erythrobacter aureus]|uniref:Site-specific integrase n=1 Tax=Erythrobacter aureus TaxID=2182384 RepID=A0A345YHT7_9SPHN|nr:site-specific integrase [Erythrobacter aureus]
MKAAKRPIGRPRRFARFEEFEASLPAQTGKRAAYCDCIGIYKGAKTTSVFVKITLPKGGIFRKRSIPPGDAVEIKLGKRSSWDWPELTLERDRLQGLADKGLPLEADEVPHFADYAADWLERRKPTMRSFGVTRGNVKSALNPSFGKKALNAISVSDVNRWIGQQSKNLKPASVQRQLNTFNAIMNDAVQAGLIDRNPSDRADKIRGIEPRLRFVTDDEWTHILATAEKIEAEQREAKKRVPQQTTGWLNLFLIWALNSGMRRSEIMSLTWSSVRKIDQETTVVEVLNTKTSRPRHVTCTDEMKAVLVQLEQLDRAEGDQRLFPISMTTLKRTLSKLWKETGLDIRLHDLRRTHATILVGNNVDVRAVASRLGHSNTAMLAQRYAVDRGDMAAARAFNAKRRSDEESAKKGNGSGEEPKEEGVRGSLGRPSLRS